MPAHCAKTEVKQASRVLVTLRTLLQHIMVVINRSACLLWETGKSWRRCQVAGITRWAQENRYQHTRCVSYAQKNSEKKLSRWGMAALLTACAAAVSLPLGAKRFTCSGSWKSAKGSAHLYALPALCQQKGLPTVEKDLGHISEFEEGELRAVKLQDGIDVNSRFRFFS